MAGIFGSIGDFVNSGFKTAKDAAEGLGGLAEDAVGFVPKTLNLQKGAGGGLGDTLGAFSGSLGRASRGFGALALSPLADRLGNVFDKSGHLGNTLGGGLTGYGLGTALAGVLAPFTGGSSLGLIPILGGLGGGAIGNALTGHHGGGDGGGTTPDLSQFGGDTGPLAQQLAQAQATAQLLQQYGFSGDEARQYAFSGVLQNLQAGGFGGQAQQQQTPNLLAYQMLASQFMDPYVKQLNDIASQISDPTLKSIYQQQAAAYGLAPGAYGAIADLQAREAAQAQAGGSGGLDQELASLLGAGATG